MPANERHSTGYIGVYYIVTTSPVDGKPEKVFYIRYKLDGIAYEEKVGSWSRGGITPAKASHIRADKMTGKTPPKSVQRESDKKRTRYTIDELFEEFREAKKSLKSMPFDINRYEKHIRPVIGSKDVAAITPNDITKLTGKLSAQYKAQTVKHVLTLIRRIVNYGVYVGMCPPLGFRIAMPKVDNVRTEFLTADEIERLLAVLDAETNKTAVAVIMLALSTGMRRGEIFGLCWNDIDFERGFLFIREPKGGKGATIPLNATAMKTLRGVERSPGSPLVFPGKNGKRRRDMPKPLRRIREAAGLPKDFRPMHGLRHTFASTLASSGEVDLYTLQRLLTHKSPQMTQRYAHLRDEAMKQAADVADSLFRVEDDEEDVTTS